MNRIVIIGNGFDLAHGLPTGYKDFINYYWENVDNVVFKDYLEGILSLKPHKDNFINFQIINDEIEVPNNFTFPIYGEDSFITFCNKIEEHNRHTGTTGYLVFENKFFRDISTKCTLTNWVDIENEYYISLKKLLNIDDSKLRSEKIIELNEEFNSVKNLLEKYLTSVCKKQVDNYKSITEAIEQSADNKEIANSRKEILIRDIKALDLSFTNDPNRLVRKYAKESNIHCNNIVPKETLFLNFNYTNTIGNLYVRQTDEIINIHGELNSTDNPIVFGYGDELDDAYKEIEKLQDNHFLENIKSIKYHKTHNYQKLLNFIEYEPYQIFIMGHSCGNSDRTLLNTLFEHQNCVSIKVFYRQYGNGSDDHENLTRNISRNFNDKRLMRDIVVNWEYCSPLVPII